MSSGFAETSIFTQSPGISAGVRKVRQFPRWNPDVFLFIVLGLCVIRLWIMPLPSSFWVDEMGTVFVVHNGAAAPSLEAAPQVAASVYYALPKLAEQLFGASEISYRIFSVLAMAATLWIVGLLAARLIHPQIKWLAVFGCLILRDFNYQAADARPYALGSLTFALALLLLLRWLDSGHTRDALWFAAVASLLWWVQLIFWPFYLVFIAYAGFRFTKSRTPATWRQGALVMALIAAATFPVALTALRLLHSAASHVIVPRPVLSDFTAQIKWSTVVGVCAVTALISRYRRWHSVPWSVSLSSIVLITGWWLLDPLVIYAFSWFTGNSVFVSRYMFPAVPGVVLVMTLLVSQFVPPRLWKSGALLLATGVLLLGGHWGRLWPAHQVSNWKSAAFTLQQWAGDEQVPVICPSPFIEARPPVWQPGVPASGFLYSHLSFYPMSGPAYAFPFEPSPEAQTYARTLVNGTLAGAGRFAIYGGDRNVGFWRQWFAARPEFETWHSKLLGSFGDVQLAVFCARDSDCRLP